MPAPCGCAELTLLRLRHVTEPRVGTLQHDQNCQRRELAQGRELAVWDGGDGTRQWFLKCSHRNNSISWEPQTCKLSGSTPLYSIRSAGLGCPLWEQAFECFYVHRVETCWWKRRLPRGCQQIGPGRTNRSLLYRQEYKQARQRAQCSHQCSPLPASQLSPQMSLPVCDL